MAQDKAPSRQREGISLIDPKTGMFTQAGALAFEELWRQVVAGFVVVPCTCINTGNDFTLKTRLHKEGAASYGDHMIFSAVASATSTGNATAHVQDAEGISVLKVLKVFKDGGSTQAGNNDIIAGRLYLFCFVGSLDGGAGGLVLK